MTRRVREAIADRKHTEARRSMKSSLSMFSAAPIKPSIKKKYEIPIRILDPGSTDQAEEHSRKKANDIVRIAPRRRLGQRLDPVTKSITLIII
jgi:hypothetical protein